MEEALVTAWHKVKTVLTHIEEALGFVPDAAAPVPVDASDSAIAPADPIVTADSGSNGPPPGHN